MHAVGLHSALAIKRQRKRRDEQRRAKERRYSSQSGESGLTSPRASTVSLDQHMRQKRRNNAKYQASQGMVDSKVVTSIGMLHIGVVFLVSGIFLLISGILPDEVAPSEKKIQQKWWNELIAVGLFLMVIGCFLILLNSIIARREEDELEQYVQRQLTRSKSGHRLERDSETGGLTTKHAKHAKKIKSIQEFNQELSASCDIENTQMLMKESPVYVHASFLDQDINASKNANNVHLSQISEEELLNDNYNASQTNTANHVSKIHFNNALNFQESCEIKHPTLYNVTAI